MFIICLQLETEHIIQFEKEIYEVPASAAAVEVRIKIEPKSTGGNELGTKWKIPENVDGIVNGPDKGTITFKHGEVRYSMRRNEMHQHEMSI